MKRSQDNEDDESDDTAEPGHRVVQRSQDHEDDESDDTAGCPLVTLTPTLTMTPTVHVVLHGSRRMHPSD